MEKKLRLFSLLLLFSVSFVACKDDSEPVDNEPVVTNHAYMGDWEGTFTGGDSGTWTCTIDKDGKLEGQMFSNNGQAYYGVTGSVDDNGKFDATIDVNGVIIDFDGQGVDGKTASGTWSNAQVMISGTWTGAKK
ncbi:MAG: hypothetical protein H6606_10055 [Flavobacteriales bacterium]|nr:hypothetical protein [Flavobacteriales bacterium]